MENSGLSSHMSPTTEIPTPFVSVIIPIRNEEMTIDRCLDSIRAQDYPKSFMETIVVDGISDDQTRTVLQDYSKAHPDLKMQVLDNPERIVPSGLNIAIRQAQGEIILRVDGHTVIARDYVSQCVDALRRTGADDVGGRMNAIGENQFGKVVALATSHPFGIGGSRFHFSRKEEWVETVYMGAWPKRVFEKIGLFDEELVRDQDDEFNYRLRKNGGRILLSQDICSEYTVRASAGALWKQYFQYGYWKVRVLQKHPRQMSIWQFIPALMILGITIFIVMELIPGIEYLSIVLPSIYLLSNLIVSFLIARKSTWKDFFILPWVFMLLHFGYGLGFTLGQIKFLNRWGDRQGKTPTLKIAYD